MKKKGKERERESEREKERERDKNPALDPFVSITRIGLTLLSGVFSLCTT